MSGVYLGTGFRLVLAIEGLVHVAGHVRPVLNTVIGSETSLLPGLFVCRSVDNWLVRLS